MGQSEFSKRILFTGCSGGGKTTLLNALNARGYATVDEPGRRIVKEELASGGKALPWLDPEAFARRALDMAFRDLELVGEPSNYNFFDRGLVDAAVALEQATKVRAKEVLGDRRHYRREVFLFPPWPEFYCNDAERKHGFEDAVSELERISTALPKLGYTVLLVPKVSIAERVDFVLAALVAR